MVVITLAAAAAIALSPTPARAAAPALLAALAPAAAQQDSADSLYRVARGLMNGGDYRKAAEEFARIGARYPKSPYAAEALYYRAFSLYRAGGNEDLRGARESLRALRAMDSQYREDAASLDTRICGELARRGDARCAAAVAQRADELGIGGVVESAVAVAGQAARGAMSVAAEAMQSRQVQNALADAEREVARAGRDAARDVEGALRETERGLRDAAIALGDVRIRSGRSSQDCTDPDNDERVIALNALTQMDAESAVPLLRKVMARRDRCSEVLRRRAVFLLSQKRSPEVAQALIEAARNDPDREVREQAVYALSRVPGETSLNFLREIATRPGDTDVRKRAVYALATMRAPEARAALRDVAASRDADAEVRAEAIYRLGSSGDDLAFLRELYPRLESRELKERALQAMGRTAGNEEWLLDVALSANEPVELRKQALSQVGNRRNVPLDRLFALYDRVTDRELKETLIYTYSRRSEPAAVDRMISIARNEKDVELRKAAVGWLARSKSNDPRVLAFLQELLNK